MVNATIITTEPDKANLALGTSTLAEDGVTLVVTPSNHFATGLSADGLEPATHYIASGFFNDEELNVLLNSDIEWKVRFGKESSEFIEEEGLKMVTPTEEETNPVEEPIE